MSGHDAEQKVRAAIAHLVRSSLILLVRLLTAVRADGVPQPCSATSPACVYFANHGSHADSVLLWAVLPASVRSRLRPVAAADYWTGGWLRRFLATSAFNSVLVDRTRAGDRPDPVGAMARALDSGDSLILFPEGTRNTSDEKLLRFRSGLFRLALARPQTQFVPVWIDQVDCVLPKGALIPVPHACAVRFGSAVSLRMQEAQSTFLARAREALLELAPNGAMREATAR